MGVARRMEAAPLEIEATGAEFTQRLSDKILSAFTHAYAAGEVEIARHLRRLLESSADGAQRARKADGKTGRKAANRRSNHDPVARADRWVAFVEARNRYRSMLRRKGAAPQEVERALEIMKDAYRDWSRG